MRELAEVEMTRDRGEISEEQLEQAVDELLERLEYGRQLRMEREHSYGE
jgi:hypothetical protein